MDAERPRRRAARGSLLGVACGDALGAPFEGATTVAARDVRAWATSSRPLRWTDDTAMTLVLARHLVATGGVVDEEALAWAFAEEWRADPHRGYGSLPPAIFRAALTGGDWADVARSAFGGRGSWGNGGAMRVAPAAFAPTDLAGRVDLARRQAAVTHTHPLGQDGAALQCAAVAQAAATAGRSLDLDAFLAAVASHVRTTELAGALGTVGEVVRQRAAPEDVAAALGHDVSAPGSVPAALACFLRWPDDVEAAVSFAVQVGGDADTIAAMAGALVGARVGDSGVPTSWTERLEGADDIVALADALTALPRKGGG